jgi:hypothetical protein
MAEKSHGTWYVSVEPPREKRKHASDRNILERARGQAIREGEIGRHTKCYCGHAQSASAKTTIAATQMLLWLEEPDEDDLA